MSAVKYTDANTGTPCEMARLAHEDETKQRTEILRMTYPDGNSYDAKPEEVGVRFIEATE